MESILGSFNWCDGGRIRAIDLGYRVSCSALEEEEEEWAVGIRANVKKEVYK